MKPTMSKRVKIVTGSAVLVLLLGGAVGLAERGEGSPGGGPGPTATASVKDLVRSGDASGTLRRADQTVLGYASPVATGSTPDATGGEISPAAYTETIPPSSSAQTPTDGGDPTAESATAASTSTSSSTSTPTSTPTSTTEPPTCPTDEPDPPSSSPKDPHGDTDDDPDGDDPEPCETPTTEPPEPTEPTTPSQPTKPVEPAPAAQDPAPQNPAPQPEGRAASGGAAGGLTGGTGAVGSGGSATGSGSETVDPATLTWLIAPGSAVDRGTVLYRADDEPTVALIGAVPAWRSLSDAVDDGPDVRQLEENLVALGYDVGTVDESFTAATAAAVADWETDLGRADPDGTVSLGEITFISEPGDVVDTTAEVGESLQAGTPVLTLGSRSQAVDLTVDVDDAPSWTVGSPVTMEWSDGTTTPATVVSVGRDVEDGNVTVVAALEGSGELRPNGTGVDAELVAERRDGVLAVPISAISAGPDDGTVVSVVGSGDDRTTEVTTGLVAGGWVEITSGLEAGQEVRLPG